METTAKEREPFISRALYYSFKWPVLTPLIYGYFRGRIYGAEKVPKKGPVVIVSNHASYVDPLIVGSCANRPVAFMAKEELFEVPLLKQWMKLYGAYPVKRAAADRSAIRAAVSSLNEGWAAGIFLGGTRTPDGRVHDPKLGAALIAAKVNAPLLPVSVWGTEKILLPGNPILKPAPVTVRFGELIPPPKSSNKEELLALTSQCAEAIHKLHDLGR